MKGEGKFCLEVKRGESTGRGYCKGDLRKEFIIECKYKVASRYGWEYPRRW